MNEFLGIDISMAQGIIDWDKLADVDGLEFVIIRATMGTATDSKFERNIAECERVDIPYGLYFTSSATSVEGAKAEAEAAKAILKKHKPLYGAWYDVELAKQLALNNDVFTGIYGKWLETVGELGGFIVGIYSNKSTLDKKFRDSDLLERYPLWYAAYPSTRAKGLSDYPQENRLKLSYPKSAIWQWSSTGRVDGIGTNVDLNVCYETFVDDSEDDGYITLEQLRDMLVEKGVRGITI